MKTLLGKKIGKLIVLEESKTRNNYFLCQCECGNLKEIRKDHLKRGEIKSCGCLLKKDNMKTETRKKVMNQLKIKNQKYNNLSHTKLYRVWYDIKRKCCDKNYFKYKWYGARGIKICSEWENDFLNFYNWAINNGFDGKLDWRKCTIDRIDNNGNYEPNNCRFVDLKTQAQNTRKNINIKFLGQTHCLSEWSRILKMSKKKIKELFNVRSKI